MAMTATRDAYIVEHHMGTAITLAGRGIDDDLVAAFFGRIRHLERLLSRFRPDSDLTLLAEGRAAVDDVDRSVREVLARCADLRSRTDRWFDHEPRRADGGPAPRVLDTDGFAKGWIVEQAALELRLAGVPEFFVNAGGDVVVHGPWRTKPYRIGIQHPLRPTALVEVLEVADGAVATSATYERGEHIRGVHDRQIVSATVVGPELGEADALATAVFAAGRTVPEWWDRFEPHHSLLTVTSAGRVHRVPSTR